MELYKAYRDRGLLQGLSNVIESCIGFAEGS